MKSQILISHRANGQGDTWTNGRPQGNAIVQGDRWSKGIIRPAIVTGQAWSLLVV